MKTPLLNKKFNLKNQLIKDEFARLKNFNLDERSSEPSLSEGFANRIATGTDESRSTESKGRAFGDYSDRLGDSKFYGERDQFGTARRDVSADPSTGDLVVGGDSYAMRDFNVPFNEAGGGSNKRMRKKYPLMTSYSDPMPDEINPMYINPNKGLGRDYVSQQIRNRDAGVDYDENAISSFQQGSGTQYFRPSNMNTFESTIGRDPATRTNRGGADYRIGDEPSDEMDKQEKFARYAMNARDTANQAVQNAIDSGNFEEAQNILNSGFNTIADDLGDYQNPNKAWRGTNYPSRTGGGEEGAPRMGERPMLYNPGSFYGSRVKDNLEYRRDASADKYNTEYLPTRSEEVDREAYKRLQAQRFRNIGNRFRGNVDDRTGDVNYGGQ